MKIPLERSIHIGLSTACLTIVLISLVQYRAMRNLNDSNEWVSHTNGVLAEIAAAQSAFEIGEAAERGYVLSGDSALLATAKSSFASANGHERELRRLTSDNPRQQQRLDRFGILLGRRARRTGGGDTSQEIRSVSHELQDEESRLLRMRVDAVQRGGAKAKTIGAIATIFSLLLLGAASIVIRFDRNRQRKLEADLRHEKHLFVTLMDTVPDCVYFKDAESRFVRMNAAMGRRLGLADASSAAGKTDSEFVHPEVAAKTRADEADVLRTGRPVIDKEELEPSLGGGQAWVNTSKLPIYGAGRTVVGTFGIYRDITVRKQAEQALERANSMLAGTVTQLETRNRESALLGELGELLQTCMSEQEAEKVIAQFARELFPGLSGALSMTNASRNLVERMSGWGDSTVFSAVFQPENCWGLRRGRTHEGGGLQGRPRCAHVNQEGAGTYVCVPMMAHGEALGVLHLSQPGGEDLDEGELRLATTVAERIGLAIANLRLRAELEAKSIRDPLTGLFNRRYMEESLERELSRAQREKASIGAIMLDLDHFKRFNDTFGHDAGDTLLKEFGQLLLSNTRKEDIVCRYGGEEFFIIIPGAGFEDTHRRAEDLREAVKRFTVSFGGRPVGPVTASIGVAVYPNHARTIEGLVHAADSALYKAKRRGRDCVVLQSA